MIQILRGCRVAFLCIGTKLLLPLIKTTMVHGGCWCINRCRCAWMACLLRNGDKTMTGIKKLHDNIRADADLLDTIQTLLPWLADVEHESLVDFVALALEHSLPERWGFPNSAAYFSAVGVPRGIQQKAFVQMMLTDISAKRAAWFGTDAIEKLHDLAAAHPENMTDPVYRERLLEVERAMLVHQVATGQRQVLAVDAQEAAVWQSQARKQETEVAA